MLLLQTCRTCHNIKGLVQIDFDKAEMLTIDRKNMLLSMFLNVYAARDFIFDIECLSYQNIMNLFGS